MHTSAEEASRLRNSQSSASWNGRHRHGSLPQEEIAALPSITVRLKMHQMHGELNAGLTSDWPKEPQVDRVLNLVFSTSRVLAWL